MTQALENLLQEERKFAPSDDFVAQANAKPGVHEEAAAGYKAFWKGQALDRISWFKEPTEVLDDSNPPFYKWFKDGELNLTFNCLDRHLDEHGDQVAYHWIGEPGDTRTLTYNDLAGEVNKFANGLKSLGLEKGDRVAVYMGMIPELPIAMLACARLGLVHSVVFGGFSSDALASRIIDAEAKVVITQDGSWRAGNVVPLKDNTDVSLEQTPGVEHVIVVNRTDHGVSMVEGRDVWWHDLVDSQCGGSALHPVHLRDHRKAEGNRS
jgi:acetyl-CoA synthetase